MLVVPSANVFIALMTTLPTISLVASLLLVSSHDNRNFYDRCGRGCGRKQQQVGWGMGVRRKANFLLPRREELQQPHGPSPGNVHAAYEGQTEGREGDKQNDKKRKKICRLLLGGNYTYASEPLLRAVSEGSGAVSGTSAGEDVATTTPTTTLLREFFSRDETLDILLCNGRTREVERVPLSPPLEELLEQERRYYGIDVAATATTTATTTTTDPVVVVVCTSKIYFPGIVVTSEATCAVRTNGFDVADLKDCESCRGHDDRDVLPLYELLLLSEERTVDGPKPLVWLYDQLVGSGVVEDAGDGITDQRRGGHALSRIYAKKTAADGGTERESNNTSRTDAYSLFFDSQLDATLEFPSWLRRLLPTSRENMEKRASEAVMKTVARDIVTSVDFTRGEFREWVVKQREVEIRKLGLEEEQ